METVHASSQNSVAASLLGCPGEAGALRCMCTWKGLGEVGWKSSSFLGTEKPDTKSIYTSSLPLYSVAHRWGGMRLLSCAFCSFLDLAGRFIHRKFSSPAVKGPELTGRRWQHSPLGGYPSTLCLLSLCSSWGPHWERTQAATGTKSIGSQIVFGVKCQMRTELLKCAKKKKKSQAFISQTQRDISDLPGSTHITELWSPAASGQSAPLLAGILGPAR